MTFAPTAPAPTPAMIEVRVKKGDALEKIARAHHTTVVDIMKLNQLSSTRLSIGQVLKIQPGQSKVENPTAPASNPNEATSKYYTVRSGDNPWTIAVKNHMKLDDLLKLNGLNEEKARRLKPGDQIRIQ
jgi:peptidoglycan DL-endopeptidase LytF